MLVAPHVYKKENELTGAGGSSQIAKNLNNVYKSNIFVKFVPTGVTKEEFVAKFSKACRDGSKIASSKLEDHVMNVNGESFSNYQKGFILYENVQDAQRAIQLFHNSNEFGFKRPIEVDFWRSKDDMKKQNDEKSINDILQLINIQRSQ